MSWFERHVHWSIVLGWLTTGVVAFVLLFFTSSESGEALFAVYGALFTLSLLTGVWGLKVKGQSMSWIFLFFIPFGWVVILTLSNKNAVRLNECTCQSNSHPPG